MTKYYPLLQGWLDSLCGVYSIVNANRLVNGVSYTDSQPVFNFIIEELHKKRILHKVLIEGINHKNFSSLMYGACRGLFPYMDTNRRNFKSLSAWWKYSKAFLEEKPNRAVILSIGGLHDHLTVVERMSDKQLILFDSDGFKRIYRGDCRLYGYNKKDKNIIYYSQCWYLGSE